MKALVLAAFGLTLASTARAESGMPAARAESGMPSEPAFVEHRLALQLSDETEAKQALVLSVANNVLKSFGPDKVVIEIVTFGPGIALLRDGNPNAERISSLAAQGVHFDICMNTVATVERTTGKPFPMSKLAHPVDAGVVQLMTLFEHGYTAIRP